jgi:hypothetical protein
VAEPSNDKIAAPDIKATAKSSTEGATPTFLGVELRHDHVDGKRQPGHQPSSHQPTDQVSGSFKTREFNRCHIRGDRARNQWSPLYPPGAPCERTRYACRGWLNREIGSKGRNYLANSGLNEGELCTRSAAMRLHTYRDESHSRHFDLVSGGQHPRSIDLVVILTSILLVVGAVCALIAVIDANGTVGLAHWVR